MLLHCSVKFGVHNSVVLIVLNQQMALYYPEYLLFLLHGFKWLGMRQCRFLWSSIGCKQCCSHWGLNVWTVSKQRIIQWKKFLFGAHDGSSYLRHKPIMKCIYFKIFLNYKRFKSKSYPVHRPYWTKPPQILVCCCSGSCVPVETSRARKLLVSFLSRVPVGRVRGECFLQPAWSVCSARSAKLQ